MTYEPNTDDRDQAIRDMAGNLSKAASGHPVDIAIGGAMLFLVAQIDHQAVPGLAEYAAKKLRMVADILDPALPAE